MLIPFSAFGRIFSVRRCYERLVEQIWHTPNRIGGCTRRWAAGWVVDGRKQKMRRVPAERSMSAYTIYRMRLSLCQSLTSVVIIYTYFVRINLINFNRKHRRPVRTHTHTLADVLAVSARSSCMRWNLILCRHNNICAPDTTKTDANYIARGDVRRRSHTRFYLFVQEVVFV